MADLIERVSLQPGDKVAIGDGHISGVIERVILARGMTVPIYLVEWWQEGNVMSREFHADDVTEDRK